jgi:c-di-GMP-binding flagellar brake protein YcgR
LGQVLGDEIRIGFPEFIERIQRRKHFRLKVPIGTELHFEVDSKRCIMSEKGSNLLLTLMDKYSLCPDL